MINTLFGNLQAAKVRWPGLFDGVDSATEDWIIDQMHTVKYIWVDLVSVVMDFKQLCYGFAMLVVFLILLERIAVIGGSMTGREQEIGLNLHVVWLFN